MAYRCAQFSGERTHRLPNTKAACLARTHHQCQLKQERPGTRPVRRLRHRLRCGRAPRPSMGRDRHIREGSRSRTAPRSQIDLDLFRNFEPIRRSDIPSRTDLGKLPSYRTHKHQLFGKQEGRCGGCRESFPFRNFTIDHLVPQSKGGTDHFDNLQLLCGACNSAKGAGTQAELIAKLKEQGLR